MITIPIADKRQQDFFSQYVSIMRNSDNVLKEKINALIKEKEDVLLDCFNAAQ